MKNDEHGADVRMEDGVRFHSRFILMKQQKLP